MTVLAFLLGVSIWMALICAVLALNGADRGDH